MKKSCELVHASFMPRVAPLPFILAHVKICLDLDFSFRYIYTNLNYFPIIAASGQCSKSRACKLKGERKVALLQNPFLIRLPLENKEKRIAKCDCKRENKFIDKGTNGKVVNSDFTTDFHV